MERVDVVSDGDLILVVGNKLELRVSLVVLRLNSSVLRAMLGPNGSEGKASTGSTSLLPGKIKLVDDDADAMKVLCLVLHSQNDKVPQCPSPAELLAFASAADKYDCLMAFGLVAEAWLSRIKYPSFGTGGQIPVLHVVYLFDFAVKIENFTLPESRRLWDCNCDQNYSDDWYRDRYPGEIENLEWKARAVTFSMCLDCFKAGGKFQGTCRVPH